VSWLLDADVLSQAARPKGDRRVVGWMEREEPHCHTSTIVIAQLAYWVRTKEGRSRDALQAWLRQLLDAMEGRVLGFSVAVAHVWAEQQRALDAAGLRMPLADGYIAATAWRHGLTVVTGNDRDFRRPGVKVFNPFKELD
jgi:predicted nucleic acid-binding protein